MLNKRRPTILISIGLLAVCGFVYWKSRRMDEGVAELRFAQSENQSSLVSANIPPVAPQSKPSPKSPLSVLSLNWTPINFYGKVIDQNGAPVSDAIVELEANKVIGKPLKYTRKSDAGGLFSLTGSSGIALSVGVSKSGYLSYPEASAEPSIYAGKASAGLFEYAISSKGPYQSSKSTPTIFTLYKLSALEPLVRIGKKNLPKYYQVACDGTPTNISLDEKGGHIVSVRSWNKTKEPPAGEYKYDWKFEIGVPKGGLIIRRDPFAFEAPKNGYLPKDIVDMPATLSDGVWNSVCERGYFVQFEDGTFARMFLDMRVGSVDINSFLNPKPESRNLESEP